jgi:hypothetical protein
MTAFRGFGFVPQRVQQQEDLSEDIISYGRLNTYPQEVEYAVSRSGIASACLDKYAGFLYGNGFERGGDIVINTRGHTLNMILKSVCYDYALNGGFALHMNINALGEYTSIHHQKFSYVRLCIPEDRVLGVVEYCKVSNNWAGEAWQNNANTFDAIRYELFNPKELNEVVGMDLMEYNGQIMYFTDNAQFYTKSPFDSVIEQIKTSGDLAEYDRRFVNNGFSASKVFINKDGASDDIAYERNVEEIGKMAGVQSAGGAYYMEGNIEELNTGASAKTADQYGTLKDGLKDDISEAIGLPPILLGRTRQGGFPNQDELVNGFMFYNGFLKDERTTIARQFDKIADYFMYPLLPAGERFNILPKKFELV